MFLFFYFGLLGQPLYWDTSVTSPKKRVYMVPNSNRREETKDVNNYNKTEKYNEQQSADKTWRL